MTKLLASIKAIITRLVFASHSFIATWQVIKFKKNPLFWYLSSPTLLLFFEGIFTLTIKANQEWKWFCPSVFLYLSSVVPAIWLLELDKVDKRLEVLGKNMNISEDFNLKYLAATDLKHLKKVLGVNIYLPDIQISTETWVTIIEQFLMLILIIGRWMLPKGDLTRDQLSQLLLIYIGTAADIIEFLDSFKEDCIAREPMLVYLTLGIWAWSLMQFTVVLTATKSTKSRQSSGSTGKTRINTSCGSIDVWGIALNMILQDGPFLAFRLILIIHYQIVSYMNIFFTCKNTLVLLLQFYRLYVLQAENKSSRHEERKNSREDKDTRSKNSKERRRDVESNYSDCEETTQKVNKSNRLLKDVSHSKSSRNCGKYKNSQRIETKKKCSCKDEYKSDVSSDKEDFFLSSRNSGEYRNSQRIETKKKCSCKNEYKSDVSSDRKNCRRKLDSESSSEVLSSEEEGNKFSKSVKMKSGNNESSKRRKNEYYDSEEELTTKEMDNKMINEESESESKRKRYVHRKRRQNRD